MNVHEQLASITKVAMALGYNELLPYLGKITVQVGGLNDVEVELLKVYDDPHNRGTNKVAAIKRYRELTGKSLKEGIIRVNSLLVATGRASFVGVYNDGIPQITMQVPPTAPTLVVTEGVESRWFYHLSMSNNTREALCGNARVMPSNTGLADWGVPSQNSDLRYKYCKACEEAARTKYALSQVANIALELGSS